MTYEGLIHGVFGIKHGYIDVEPAVVGLPPAADGRRVKREMNNNDELYAQVRSLNFGELGPCSRSWRGGVHERYEERHAAHTVSQIRDFMKKLGQLQNLHKSLSAHVGLAGRIQQHERARLPQAPRVRQLALASGAIRQAEAYVDELIAEGAHRRCCGCSACSRSSATGYARRRSQRAGELLAQYGYDKIAMTLGPLQRLGLLKRNDGRSTWPTLKKALRLVVDLPEYEAGAEPADMAYVTRATRRSRCLRGGDGAPRRHGDAPERQAEGAARPARRPRPGRRRRRRRRRAAAAAARAAAPAAATGDGAAAADGVATGAAAPPPVTLVYFVGGVTFAEIAAVR